jgi:hypothetical protein
VCLASYLRRVGVSHRLAFSVELFLFYIYKETAPPSFDLTTPCGAHFLMHIDNFLQLDGSISSFYNMDIYHSFRSIAKNYDHAFFFTKWNRDLSSTTTIMHVFD